MNDEQLSVVIASFRHIRAALADLDSEIADACAIVGARDEVGLPKPLINTRTQVRQLRPFVTAVLKQLQAHVKGGQPQEKDQPRKAPKDIDDDGPRQCDSCKRFAVPEVLNGDGLCPVCSVPVPKEVSHGQEESAAEETDPIADGPNPSDGGAAREG